MFATTYGNGPFYPAINLHQRLWIAQVAFDDEDDAASAAISVVEHLDAKTIEYIVSLGYKRR